MYCSEISLRASEGMMLTWIRARKTSSIHFEIHYFGIFCEISCLLTIQTFQKVAAEEITEDYEFHQPHGRDTRP